MLVSSVSSPVCNVELSFVVSAFNIVHPVNWTHLGIIFGTEICDLHVGNQEAGRDCFMYHLVYHHVRLHWYVFSTRVEGRH